MKAITYIIPYGDDSIFAQNICKAYSHMENTHIDLDEITDLDLCEMLDCIIDHFDMMYDDSYLTGSLNFEK